MPRRKPASAKQRKAELQLKRAIKRGDVEAPPPQPKPPRRKGLARHDLSDPFKIKVGDPSSKRLQSAFLKVEPEFLERSRQIASTDALQRPLPIDSALLCEKDVGLLSDSGPGNQLTCPRRPKWRYDMSKKEVEANEQGLYKKWFLDTEEQITAWRASRPLKSDDSSVEILGSPTYYERNLEVWRQLWRVTEISQIMLVLLDSRCPLLHFPPSLQAYLSSFRPNRPLIIVLTKSDVVPEIHGNAWTTWIKDRFPSARVVRVRSYREQDPEMERKGQGQRRKHEPEISGDELRELVEAMKAAHLQLITPPEHIRGNEEKLANWKSLIPVNVDWDAVLHGNRAELFEHQDGDEENPEFLTIGLIGQPNVGKSSLLNALFGTHKVKASRTPGKTKHFQTLFWTKDIRLVDCPGLVMPSFVPMELQVLGAILPISQIPSIPACLHYILSILPLEEVLKLEHPSLHADVVLDKRTWRGDHPRNEQLSNGHQNKWTTMDVLSAYATKKGWVTAKAGRPDANRAGNALLRALAEGRIGWGFRPPGIPIPDGAVKSGDGIWLGNLSDEASDDGHSDVASEAASSDTEEEEESHRDDEDKSEEMETEEEEAGIEVVMSGGRFGALTIEDVESEDEGEGEEG